MNWFWENLFTYPRILGWTLPRHKRLLRLPVIFGNVLSNVDANEEAAREGGPNYLLILDLVRSNYTEAPAGIPRPRSEEELIGLSVKTRSATKFNSPQSIDGECDAAGVR